MKKDQEKELPPEIVEYIQECRSKEHSESYLIPVLQEVQNRFGYLSKEHMDQVSQLMQVPSAAVTGTASFYHFFSFEPKGRTRVTICMGTACFVRGADKVRDRVKELLGVEEGKSTPDGKFSFESARCIGACALAPVMVVNDEVHGNVTPDQVESILEKYGFGGDKQGK
jgi:NADH:ubiquinone oxidoreductase subunit E